MKKFYLLILSAIVFGDAFSQTCSSLGCAGNYGTINVDGTLSDVSGSTLGAGCINSATYKQVFWQFFYSPAGGVFTQAYTPVPNGVDALDLDYIVFDIGTVAPSAIPCPVDPTAWPDIICNNAGTDDVATGPGVAGAGGNVLTTTAGHYYAIAVTSWQGTSNGGVAAYFFTIGNPQLGGVDLTPANCPGVLPVTLSSFKAAVNNCNVDLSWEASESNFKNYEVQTSTDGLQFQSIGTISGSQQAGSQKKYTYQYIKPRQGTSYYRLKMLDADGKAQFSKIISAQLACGRNSFIIYPNPVTDFLNVSIDNARNNITLASLFDTNGKLMYSGKMAAGTNMIDMMKFSRGVYWLRLKNNLETKNIKVIK
ncbi:MAG: T9SS type A sorting domain-containing protein [Ginsengibacter sp.]